MLRKCAINLTCAAVFLLLIHSTTAVLQRMEVDTVDQKFQSNAKDASTQTQLNVEDASTQTCKCMCTCIVCMD